MKKNVILAILDGWGLTDNPDVSAVHLAKTPCMDRLQSEYPTATLVTHGPAVGLPEGQMGNSEVGHMTIGSGRVVLQDFERINQSINTNSFAQNNELLEALSYAKTNEKSIHLIGLVSDGGVHSHKNHLFSLIDALNNFGIEESYIHAFTDGRDCDPQSGYQTIIDLEKYLNDTHTRLATIVGRYYAMDRDHRWERIKIAYDALIHQKGTLTDDFPKSIQASYDGGVTDEFLKPLISSKSNTSIKTDDVVIFFNFRTDRGRELTEVLTQKDYGDYEMYKQELYFVTMTNYDSVFENIKVLFDKENLKHTLGEVIANSGKSQLRIAETEKYPHVTYFFSGGDEKAFEGEQRILCPSPKVETYDLKPEMSAPEITEAVLKFIDSNAPNFICLNFANGDMVGHTGSLEAAIKACETVDQCVSKLTKKSLEKDYTLILIADHGNCEKMKNEDGSVNTAHTTNLVPIIMVDKAINNVKDGTLADIAPTILKVMGIEQPKEMTGIALF